MTINPQKARSPTLIILTQSKQRPGFPIVNLRKNIQTHFRYTENRNVIQHNDNFHDKTRRKKKAEQPSAAPLSKVPQRKMSLCFLFRSCLQHEFSEKQKKEIKPNQQTTHCKRTREHPTQTSHESKTQRH